MASNPRMNTYPQQRRYAPLLRVGYAHCYRQRVDYWQWFDNGGDMPLLLEEGVDP